MHKKKKFNPFNNQRNKYSLRIKQKLPKLIKSNNKNNNQIL